jgi:hypothetical protein
MQDTKLYPEMGTILIQIPRTQHHLWTACRFIRDNPGCSKQSLEDHLDRTYPIGTRIRFSWILGWAGTRRYTGYAAEVGLYERLYTRDGKRSRGFHLLPRGEEVAALAEPAFTPERPKRMQNGWVTEDMQPGTMLVSRQKTRGIFMHVDNMTRTQVLAPGDFVLFHAVRQRVVKTDKWAIRDYGQPYIYAELDVLHNGTLCVVNADLVKPLWDKGGKDANR